MRLEEVAALGKAQENLMGMTISGGPKDLGQLRSRDGKIVGEGRVAHHEAHQDRGECVGGFDIASNCQ